MSMVDLTNEQSQSLAIIQKFLKVNPACCRAGDMLAAMHSVGVQRAVTEVGFNEMWPHLYQRLAAVPDLPDAAKKVADGAKGSRADARIEYPKRAALIGHLQAGSGIKVQPGPSWQVLAEMLRDVSYAQAWRILDVESNVLGLKPDSSLKRLKPLVQGHRLGKLLDCFASDRQLSLETLGTFNARANIISLEVSAVPLALQFFRKLNPQGGEADKIVSWIEFNSDAIYEDAARRLALPYYGPNPIDIVAISPHWPVSISDAITRDPKAPLAEWEEKYGESSVVLMALYRKHLANERPSDALRCLKKAVEISPQCSTYLELGKLYELRGDRDLWLQSMEKALKSPNLGLEHAQVHFELANWFMRQGKWQQAKPHAMEAVKSNSAFGLWAGSRYAEGTENWIEAEKYQQQASQRYEDAATNWYFWTLRTGRGKVKEAKALAVQHWQSLVLPLNGDQMWRAVVGHVVDGNRAAAGPLLNDLFQRPDEVKAGVYAAVLADERGEAAVRDELFRKIDAKWSAGNPFVELNHTFRGVLSGKENARWDPLAFEVLVINAAETDIPYLYLAAGQFLGNHGQKELSKEYLQCAATPFRTDSLAAVLAADALRKQKIQVGKARLNVLPDSLAPLAELLTKGLVAQKNGKFDEAEASLTQLLKTRTDFLPGLLARAGIFEAREKYAEAIADFEATIRKDPNFYQGYRNLARLLATCEKDEVRNGIKALEYAERAATLRPIETWETLTTLAWAQAECGQFDKAIELENRARKLRADPGFNERMILFKARKPYHVKAKAAAQQATE